MIFKKPTCYSAVSSLGLHLVFVLVAGSFWLSQAETSPAEKPFRLKVVSKPSPPPAGNKRSPANKVVKKRVVATHKPMPKPNPQRKRERTKIARTPKMVTSPVVPVTVSRPLKPSKNTRSRPAKAVRRTPLQGARPLLSAALSSPRFFKSSGNKRADSGKTARVVRVEDIGTGTLAGNKFSAPRALQSLETTGNTHTVGRKATKVHIDKARAIPGTIPLQALTSVTSAGTGMGNKGRVARVSKGMGPVHASPFDPRALPNVVDRGAARSYLTGIGRKIASAKEYPREAKIASQEGEVRVQFTILENGQVRDLVLVSGTPYAALNNEALEMVKRAAPFSQLPEEIGVPFLNVVLPFTFQLN